MRSGVLLAALILGGCHPALDYCAHVGDGTKKCFASERERNEYWKQLGAEQRAKEDAELAELARLNEERKQAWYERERQNKERAEAEAERLTRESLENEAKRKQEHEEMVKTERERREREEEERRLKYERERKAEEERKHAVRRRAADKQYAVPAISAHICWLNDVIRSYQDDLKREQRITAQSGVSDLSTRRAIAAGIDDSRVEIANWRSVLKKLHQAAPQPCNATLVRAIADCRTGLACPGDAKVYADLFREAEPVLRGLEQP